MLNTSSTTRPDRDRPPLRGSMAALPTPFRNGAVDHDALVTLAERHVRRGTGGLVVGGSTGEGASLALEEHALALAVVMAAAAGRVPVIAGCGAPCTDGAVRLAEAAARGGAQALLVAPPPYSKPSQDGIVAHVRAVAHASDLPIVVYDVPGRTGVAIADATVGRLFGCGLIAATKDASGDLARPGRLRALCGAGLVQLTGDDGTAAAYRAMGGHGCISVTANIAPMLCARLHEAWDAGDLANFARIRDVLAPLHDALFLDSNPVPLKAALSMLRLCTGDLRLPLLRAPATTRDRLADVLTAVMVAEDAEVAGRTRPARLALVQ